MYQKSWIPRGHIHRAVTLVLQLVDTFTDTVITGSGACVRCLDTGELSLHKSDGYFVFIRPMQGRVKIEISVPLFTNQTIEVDLSLLPQGMPLFCVALCPNRQYGLPSGTACVYGRATPNAEIMLMNAREAKPFKLLSDYAAKSEQIEIFHPQGRSLQGRWLVLTQKDEPEQTLFFCGAGAKGEAGAYLLGTALNKSYKKATAVIFPIYTTRADAHGEYFLPLPGITAEGIEGWLAQGSTGVRKQLQLAAGVSQVVDLNEPTPTKKARK